MAYPTVSVESAAISDARYLTPQITVEHQFSEESPARVRIELRNTASTVTEGHGFGYVPPFDWMKGRRTDGSNHLYLIPGRGVVVNGNETEDSRHWKEFIPDAPVDGCWQLQKSPMRLDSGVIWLAESGASMVRDHAVLDHVATENCLQPGTYEFGVEWTEEPRHEASRGEKWRPDDNKHTAYSWDFTVTLYE